MAKPIRSEVDIQRSPEDVFAYLIALENEALWNEDVTAASHVSGEPGTAGATYSRTQRAMGQEMTMVAEVTEVEPGRRFTFRSNGGPAKVTGGYEVEPIADGARVVALLEAGKMTTFMRPMVEPRLESALGQLKQLLESGRS